MDYNRDDYCVETVWGSRMGSSPCQRKRGYGKNGKYCKQHALKHPADDFKPETFNRWEIHKFYDTPQKRVCIAETEKTLTLVDGSKMNKNTYEGNVYNTWAEAHSVLLRRAHAQLESAHKKIHALEAMKNPEE